MVNDEVFRSLEGKSKHALWLELADICTRHPRAVAHLNVEAILRAGIRKFTDEVCYSSASCFGRRKSLQGICSHIPGRRLP